MPRLIDVQHQGKARVIGAWLVDGYLIDPGPESAVDALLAGLGDERPRALLLTHIHFDHAGASGRLVERWPDLPVYVHEFGAQHMADPERLVASARQLYGADFDRLWGEVVPVPEDNLRVLSGGESVDGFDVDYTPGHAKHHVVYFHRDSGDAFVGDMAGVRIPPSDLTRAPTPPPDIDVEAWLESVDRIEARRPGALMLTHFDRVDDVGGQLDAVRQALRFQADLARDAGEDDFVARLEELAAEHADEPTRDSYFEAGDPRHFYLGLKRYWSKVAA